MTFLEGEKNNRMKKHRIGGGGGYYDVTFDIHARGWQIVCTWSAEFRTLESSSGTTSRWIHFSRSSLSSSIPNSVSCVR